MSEYERISLIIADVDGVLTDGSIYKGTDNLEFKKFSVFDGVGVAYARAMEMKVALISARYSPATEYRAKELGIEDVYNGGLNKITAYEELKIKYNLIDSEIAYVGDDLIDIPVMEKVGISIAVANAIMSVKEISTYITKTAGGYGAFRESVSWIIEQQGRMDDVLKTMKEHILKS